MSSHADLRLHSVGIPDSRVQDVNPTLIETRQLRALNHENIVQFLGVCTTPPVYCIVMEYCPYSDFDIYIDNCGTIRTRFPHGFICRMPPACVV